MKCKSSGVNLTIHLPLTLLQILPVSLSLTRYALMMSCWAKQPDDRPTFSEIVSRISDYTEAIAGYLDINFNPFERKIGKQVATEEGATPETPDNEKDVLVSADLLAKKLTSENVNSKGVRKLSEDKLSSASGIEIRIESPSEEGSIANNELKV